MKNHSSIVLLIVVTLFFSVSAIAKELNDMTFGFRLDVPEGFTQLQVDPSKPDTIHQFIDRNPTPDDPAHVIQIQRLRGVITPTARMKESEIPVVEGVTTAIQDFDWKGLELDVTRQALTLPTGLKYVVFTIQFPLSDEAVQLQVGGPANEEKNIFSLFQQLARKFENIKPLHAVNALEVRKLSTLESIEKLVDGIVRLAITAAVIVFLFRIVMRALSKRKKDE